MTHDAQQVLTEVLDYFQREDTTPGGRWAFPNDGSGLCLYFKSEKDGTKFWLDICRDGTIHIMWKPVGQDLKSLNFRELQDTRGIS